jgi:hypothetical protein
MRNLVSLSFLAAFLVVAVSGCCGPTATPTEASPTEAPTARSTEEPPTPAPAALPTEEPTNTSLPRAQPSSISVASPTPAIPEGYVLDSDPELRLSFVRPSGWDVDRGSKTLPESQATALFVAYSRVSPGEYKIINLAMVEQPLGRSPEEFIEDLLRGEGFFSIVLAMTRLERAYTFQWASSIEYEDELRQAYEVMLPTIKFID